MPNLAEVEVQCAATVAAVPPNLRLIEENLRGYVLLLSAHFQGFCRDLYDECAVKIVSRVRPSLRLLIQMQFSAERKLDRGNPNVNNLRLDFERFNFTLDLGAAEPANPARLNQLAALNLWRNLAAHHGTIPPGVPPLSVPVIQGWRGACDGLAASLDAILYNKLRRLLRRIPW
jgi:hypothetical protein